MANKGLRAISYQFTLTFFMSYKRSQTNEICMDYDLNVVCCALLFSSLNRHPIFINHVFYKFGFPFFLYHLNP